METSNDNMSIDDVMGAINKIGTQEEQIDKDKTLCITRENGYYKWVLVNEEGKKIGPLYEDDAQNTISPELEDKQDEASRLFRGLLMQLLAYKYLADMV
jgi:hypothetical protein